MNPFDEIFASLRQIMLNAAEGQVVARDLPGDLVVRTRRLDPKTAVPGWFGIVNIKKSYVAYHLMGLYENPDLGAGISEELKKRRQGKSCFNFRKSDPALFDELARLSEAANRLVLARDRQRPPEG